MSTLYRKYRPQTFADLIGQNHIKITLQNELERGEIGHAYLFTGPRGLGKTTTARLFAKAVNCENRKDGESEPCNACPSCSDIMANRSLDIIEIDAASHTGVDNVRENIIENARFTPNKSRYKVFVIDEVHMLSISAFNALLKTLEEPPSHAIFILCTTEIHKLPATIISRCQRFDFRKVSTADMLKRLEYVVKLEKKKVARKVLENIVINSEGCVRDAESLLGKILTLGNDITSEQAEIILPHSDFNQIIALIGFLGEKNVTAGIELVNKLVNDGVDLQIFTDDLIEFLRKVLLIRINGRLSDFGIELDEESEKAAERFAQIFTHERLIFLIDLFLAKRAELKSAFISQFPLELAIVAASETPASRPNDDPKPPQTGGGLAGETEIVFVKGAAASGGKEAAASHNPAKGRAKSEIALSNTELEKVKPEKDEIKVDLLAKADKLKPVNLVDFEKILTSWPLIVEKLLEKNYTLSSLLKISLPLRCRENVLEIGVKSKFYQERLEDGRNRTIVGEVISEVVMAEVSVKGVVKEDIQPIEYADNRESLVAESQPEKPGLAAPVAVFAKPANAAQEVIDMF